MYCIDLIHGYSKYITWLFLYYANYMDYMELWLMVLIGMFLVPKKLKLLPVNYCSCKILPLGRITSCHHIFCVKNLSCQFVDAQISIYFTASGTQRSNARSEEMQSRKRNQVGSKFSQI